MQPGFSRRSGQQRSGSADVDTHDAVDDVKAAARTAREAGAKIDSDDDLTDTPVCEMMFGYDPEGNQFILHKRKA